MSDNNFTPTTEQIRAGYSQVSHLQSFGAQTYEEADAEFDRWLAAHDAEVRTEAFETTDEMLVEIANRAQSATGRSIWPRTVRAVLDALTAALSERNE